MSALYWITGLSAAGKTTISKELFKIIRKKKANCVLLDGDTLRKAIGIKAGYSRRARLKLALLYSRLCKMLVEQDIEVICATISMFRECHRWNREHIRNYREIYVRVPMNILIKRDRKNIYTSVADRKNNSVVGVDIAYDEPKSPDLIIDNHGRESPRELASVIYKHFNKKLVGHEQF